MFNVHVSLTYKYNYFDLYSGVVFVFFQKRVRVRVKNRVRVMVSFRVRDWQPHRWRCRPSWMVRSQDACAVIHTASYEYPCRIWYPYSIFVRHPNPDPNHNRVVVNSSQSVFCDELTSSILDLVSS